MAGVPVVFRKGSKDLSLNVDYYDYAAGAGYKKFYLAGSNDSVSKKYFLTTDSSLISDGTNCYLGGNATDVDFDLTFGNSATIAAADCTISYNVVLASTNEGTFTVTWTVYHVSAASVETSLGTVTDCTSSDGDPTAVYPRTVKFTLTSKRILPGEKLRINAVIASNGSSTAHFMHIDPSGHYTYTDSVGGAGNSRAIVNIPFIVNI